jgi:serine/threonine protein phosphatase 1
MNSLVPTLPDHQRIYAIGDIHGRADLLAELLDMIDADAGACPSPKSRLVFLGDYVDRGPDSHGVVERLLTGLPDMPADFLIGNHEQLMLDAWADESRFPLWMGNGGMATQTSYQTMHPVADPAGGDPRKTEGLVPPKHWMFFERLKLYVAHGDYLFVHAGIRPGLAIPDQDPHDLMWIREPFLSHHGDLGRVVVHGHTPAEEPEFLPHRIGIDTGAVFTGRLTALVLEGDEQRVLTTHG